MKIYQSAEDYLEAILTLREKHGSVRSIDVANDLSVSKPSVSIAMKKLRESGHVKMDENGLLTLTEEGEQVARRILERHQVLTRMLEIMGVDGETAAEEACEIEHCISDSTFDKIREYLAKMP